MTMINWTVINWILYDRVFYNVSRKETIKKLIAAGLSARDAITEIKSIEKEP
jgi:hypothetical protein